jgi:hypothetical protein
MRHPIRLAVAVLSLTAALAACADGLVQPTVQAPDGPARAALPEQIEPIEPIEPIDPCQYSIEGCGGSEPPTYTPIPPFSPPPRPYEQADVPLYYGSVPNPAQCNQVPHARWGFSNDVVQGATIYMTGVVVRNTRVNFYIYDVSGNLVRTHLTRPSGSNCVVAHENEGLTTWGMAPGYYYVYASYYSIFDYYYSYETTYGYPAGVIGRFIGPLRVR